MKDLYLSIKAQIELKAPAIQFIHVFNNQFNDIEDGNVYSFPMPAVFIEFLNDTEIQQLGGGYQIYTPLTVRVHIAHDYYNAPDGTMEQNLDVFAIKQAVYSALQKFEPAGAVQFIRISETQDYDHPNVYHFIQDYQTSYVDQQQAEPVGGILQPGGIGSLELEVEYDPAPYMKPLFDGFITQNGVDLITQNNILLEIN